MPVNAFDDALTQLPKSANPFDDLADDMVAQRTSAVKTAVDRGARENPDQQAELIRTADRLRIPLDVVKRNPDAYKGAGVRDKPDLDRLFQDSPRLAQYLTASPEFASVTHDDLPQLSAMETALSRAENVVRELGAGTYRGATTGLFGMIEGAAARAMDAADQPTTARSLATSALELQGPQLFGQIAGRERASAVQQWAQAHRQAAQATVETIKGPQAGASRFEKTIYSGIESVGMTGPGLLTAVATKNPSVALALMGGQTTGEAYAQAADQGVSATKAGIFATIQGAIEVGTEALPLQWLIKDLGAGAGFLKTLAHQVFSENLGEQAATALQDLAEWKFLPENQQKPFTAYLAERPGAALDTLVATVASVGATTGIATGAHSLITGLGQAATQSKTAKRSPEAVESFVAQATKDSPAKAVYAPVETWTSYWQSKGEDPAAMATSLTGDPQAYQKAVALGTDLEIPIAKYAAKLAGTEHNTFFAQELKLDPAEMNAREAAAHVEQLRQQQEAAQPTEPAQPSTLDQATDLMTQRMVEQGIPADTAQTYGAIWRAGIGTLASNFGIDPLALQAQYGPQGGPTITREGMEPAPTTTPAAPAEAPPTETPEGAPVEVPGPEQETPETILSLRQQLGTAQQERRATERAAETDPLTGLGNRRALDKAQVAADADPNTSAVFFDANNFGQVNKVAGHDAGDATLKEMAVAIRQAAEEVGAGARVFRRGGDEFVAFIPNELAAQVRQRAEAIFGARQFIDAQGNAFEVSLTGSEGNTIAEAEAPLQAAKAARKSPLGPPNAQGEAALFIGRQETGTDEPAIPLYRVQGGPHDGTTVTQDELRQWGIPIPQVGQAQTTFTQEQRGEIRFGADRQFNIHLLERADLSTFLHETGHFFLEVFGDLTDQLATRDALTPEQQRLRDDHAALLTWLGVESRAQIGREQHEQFARGFEAYLMEGKAPSLELRSAFARARAWLLGIYKQLRNLNVTLTPEVRGIFDRLLASDAAIQQAQQTASVSGMFLNAESAGMTEAQFAGYRGDIEDASRKAKEDLDRQILAEVHREQTATWKAQREHIKEQVTTEVQAQPVYRALAAMQKGTHPNGDALIDGEETNPLKLSKTIISERYGAERLKSLPKPYIYSREGGLDPDSVAEMFGFSSGDALLTAVSTAPSMRSVIERETAGRMFQQHGSLLLDGTLGEKAQAAVANDSREEVIRKELKALHGLQRRGAATLKASVPSMTAIRQGAAQEIARTGIGNIKPQVYWSAGLRAGRQAVELAAQQKFPEAVRAKQQQLFNLALYREAVKQRDDMEARKGWINDQNKAAGRQRLAEAGGSYLDQWDGYMDRYEFTRVPQNVLDRRARLDKWIASQKAEGLAIDLPEALLDDSRRINYRQMTVEEFIGLTDGLKQLVHFARLKRKLLGRQAARDLAETATTVAERLYATATGTTTAPRLTRHKSMLDKVAKYGRDLAGSFLNADTILRELDGWEDLGPVYEHLKGGIDRAVVEDLIPRTNATAEKLSEINSVYKRGELQKKEHIPALNDSLTREEMIAFALNWGTADNRAALLESKKWAAIGANEQTAHAILDRLDKRDWDYVQSVWDYFETFWPDIEASQKRRKGVAPAKVEALPIETKYGSYRGGYYTLKYDSEGSILVKQDEIEDTLDRMRTGRYAAAATKAGFAKERIGSGGRPVLLSLSVIAQHVGEVNYDLALGDEIRSIDRILRHKTVREAFEATGRHGYYEALDLWLHDVATGEILAADTLSKTSRRIRSGLTVSALGFNLGTAAMNAVAPVQSAVVIGKRAMLRGMTDLVTRKWFGEGNVFQQVIDASPFMGERQTTFNKDIMTSMETVKDSRIPAVIPKAYYYFITKSQWLADVATWLGAHRKGLSQFDGDSEKAVAYADRMVARSQSSGLWADRTAIERGTLSQTTRQSEFVKMWTTLMSYMLAKGNVAYETTRSTNFKRPSEVAAWTVDMALLFSVEALFSALLHGQFDDDDDDWESMVGTWLAETGKNMIGVVPFARELESAIEGYPTGGPIGAAVKRLAAVYTQVEQGEFDAALVKAVNSAGGMLLKYPSSMINRVITAGTRAAEGEDVPLLDYLIYREDRGESRR